MPKSRHRNKKHNKKPLQRIINKRTRLNEQMVQQAAQMAADAQLPDKERGLYPKYRLARTDGSTNKGQKHEKCQFFVLDITHDPHAIPAIFSYATSAKADGYDKLADDLYSQIQPYIKKLNEAAGAAPELADTDVKKMTDAELCTAITTFAWEDLQIGTASEQVVSEMLARFEKLTAKPKRKYTRKKKADEAAPVIDEVQIVSAEETGVGICQTCGKPVGMFGDSHHKALGEGKFTCDGKYKDTDTETA